MSEDVPSITVPNLLIAVEVNYTVVKIAQPETIQTGLEHLVPVDRYSNFKKLVSVHMFILDGINRWKLKLKRSDPLKYDHIKCYEENTKFYAVAFQQIVLKEQQIYFPEVFVYFSRKKNY